MIDTIACYPWQTPLWHTFEQAMALNRLPHAILVHGSNGTGKRHFAQLMGQVLLCEQPDKAKACQACHSCQLFTAEHHPDFYRLQPEEVGKAIKIDAVREALAWLALSPQQGRAKVLVLHPVEQLNTAAANALLKNLEEPTANTTLVLLAEQAALVMPTLRSRCQLWHMPMPDVATRQAWLRGQGLAEDVQGQAAEGPLATLARAKAGTLNQQQVFEQTLHSFLSGKLSALAASKEIQKVPTADALNWLLAYWQKRIHQLLLQHQMTEAQHNCQQLEAILRLKGLWDKGANLNWALQWDALLCRLTP